MENYPRFAVTYLIKHWTLETSLKAAVSSPQEALSWLSRVKGQKGSYCLIGIVTGLQDEKDIQMFYNNVNKLNTSELYLILLCVLYHIKKVEHIQDNILISLIYRHAIKFNFYTNMSIFRYRFWSSVEY